jgi:homogentisate 1,2-dioxygenase
VICSFCPRELDYDPNAVPLPYHHSNVQSEEVIYYVSGDFGSRKGIEVGSITVFVCESTRSTQTRRGS